MNILVSGSTGLIGTTVCSFLKRKKHRVVRLVRRPSTAPDEITWDPASGTLEIAALEGLDAVIHLAGENIAAGRWTAQRKRLIRESRVQGTGLLAKSLSCLFDPPKVLVSVSAIGYYGNRGDELIDEQSDAGKGFLPDVCREWEAATVPAAMRGIRVVIPRIGMVLSAAGGALALMLPVFRHGIGGRIGSGRQYMSWIAIDDLAGSIHHVITNNTIHGPVNAVSPNPLPNFLFTKILGNVLARPAAFVLPAFVARFILGQMANEVLLSSAKIFPSKLMKSGYKFVFPELEGALRHVLQNPKSPS